MELHLVMDILLELQILEQIEYIIQLLEKVGHQLQQHRLQLLNRLRLEIIDL